MKNDGYKYPEPEFGNSPIEQEIKWIIEMSGTISPWPSVEKHARELWDLICESEKNKLYCARCKWELQFDDIEDENKK